jgi:hypothetical protein
MPGWLSARPPGRMSRYGFVCGEPGCRANAVTSFDSRWIDASFCVMARHAIFLSGPIGTGKTTLGRELAVKLSGSFIDGDGFSDPTTRWYCSILKTSRSIVHHASCIIEHNGSLVVIAYPLGCMNWIYFRRKFTDIGAIPLFVSLRASYSAIVDKRRGRLFSPEELDRIKIMISEGYGDRPFSDLVIDTDEGDFHTTLAELEAKIRPMLALSGVHLT